MTAREREAAERLEAWIFGSSNTPADADDIRTILAAVRRHERLANEGLTEAELEDVEFFRNEMPTGETVVGETVLHVIAKLQAQLADAKDRIIEAEGIASDALEDRGLPRIEEVRRETAKECAELLEKTPDGIGTLGSAEIIRRRFGLVLPPPIGTPPTTQPDYDDVLDAVMEIGEANRQISETPVLDVIQAWNSVPDPQPAETRLPETWIGTECQACHGSCVGSDDGPCDVCNGLGRIPPQPAEPVVRIDGGIRPMADACPRCLGRKILIVSGQAQVCSDCAGTGRVNARRPEDRP